MPRQRLNANTSRCFFSVTTSCEHTQYLCQKYCPCWVRPFLQCQRQNKLVVCLCFHLIVTSVDCLIVGLLEFVPGSVVVCRRMSNVCKWLAPFEFDKVLRKTMLVLRKNSKMYLILRLYLLNQFGDTTGLADVLNSSVSNWIQLSMDYKLKRYCY